MDERYRRAPVALPRYAPVAQSELHALVADAQAAKLRSDGVRGCAEIETVESPRIEADAVFLVSALQRLHQRRRERFDDRLDRQAVLGCKLEVALIVRRHDH